MLQLESMRNMGSVIPVGQASACLVLFWVLKHNAKYRQAEACPTRAFPNQERGDTFELQREEILE